MLSEKVYKLKKDSVYLIYVSSSRDLLFFRLSEEGQFYGVISNASIILCTVLSMLFSLGFYMFSEKQESDVI